MLERHVGAHDSRDTYLENYMKPDTAKKKRSREALGYMTETDAITIRLSLIRV